MKKIVITGMAALFAGTTAMADLSWGYSADLVSFDATLAGGELVLMYQDVNGDTGAITQFDKLGAPAGDGIADDILLSFSTTLLSGKAGVSYGTSIPTGDWASLLGESVYTVIFKGGSIAASSQAVVVDPLTTALPASDPGDYVLGSVGGSYVPVIPEPATFGLMGVAGLGLFLARRKSRR